MATLEEMRRWMSGHEVEGLPSRVGVWDFDEDMIEALKPTKKASPFRIPTPTSMAFGKKVGGATARFAGMRAKAADRGLVVRTESKEAEETTIEDVFAAAGMKTKPGGATVTPPAAASAALPGKVSAGTPPHMDRRYKLTTAGDDAEVRIGDHKGMTISAMAKSKDKRGFLKWMLTTFHSRSSEPLSAVFVDLVNRILASVKVTEA